MLKIAKMLEHQREAPQFMGENFWLLWFYLYCFPIEFHA